MNDDPDGTVRMSRADPGAEIRAAMRSGKPRSAPVATPAPPPRSARTLVLAGVAGAVLLAAAGAFVAFRPAAPPPAAPPTAGPVAVTPAPAPPAAIALAPAITTPPPAPMPAPRPTPPPAPPAAVALAPPPPAPAALPQPAPSAPAPAPAPAVSAPAVTAPAAPAPAPTVTAPVVTAFAPPLTIPAPTPPLTAPRPLPVLTEAEILARAPQTLEIYRFAPQPEIVVLHFPTLAEQARTLNRAAALIEKSGFPRDRVLDSAELDRRIRAEGAEPDSFYYGHDYRAADIVRFFDVLQASGLPPTDGEAALARHIAEWGWTSRTNAALISLVREDPAARIGPAARATILRHELSHGHYFTNPAYARYAHEFWASVLTQAERGKFRTFLAADGYDTGIEDLVVNETQAYLMHTQNDRFFNAQAVGMTEKRLDVLRVLFLTGMPPGWLRDCTTVPVRAPRRRAYRFSAVRRTRTVAETRTPFRAADSRADRSSFT